MSVLCALARSHEWAANQLWHNGWWDMLLLRWLTNTGSWGSNWTSSLTSAQQNDSKGFRLPELRQTFFPWERKKMIVLHFVKSIWLPTNMIQFCFCNKNSLRWWVPHDPQVRWKTCLVSPVHKHTHAIKFVYSLPNLTENFMCSTIIIKSV